MVLTQPWVGAALVVLLVLVVLGALTWRDRGGAGDALPLAHTERIRALPRFQTLARAHRRRSVIACLGMLLAGLGATLVAARPVDASVAADQRHNRDIVLCLDVSGSMAEVDRAALESFAALADQLQGERLSLVLFDATAVTAFPLTDDVSYIREQLSAAATEIAAGPVAGTRLGDLGSSLIGDGMSTCLDRFDESGSSRGRTLVLTTDNQVAGTPVVTVRQAAARARDAGVMIFGIVPSDNSVAATDALTTELRGTGGDVLLLGADDQHSAITSAVAAQERKALAGQPRSVVRDHVAPGVLCCLAGVLVVAGTRRRART